MRDVISLLVRGIEGVLYFLKFGLYTVIAVYTFYQFKGSNFLADHPDEEALRNLVSFFNVYLVRMIVAVSVLEAAHNLIGGLRTWLGRARD